MSLRPIVVHALFLLCLNVSGAHASEPTLRTVQLDRVTIHYELRDALSEEKEPEITRVLVAGFNHYTSLFGALPRDGEGNEYREFTVRLRHGEHLRGEADPGLIMMTWSESTLLGYMNWKTLALHELFHLWSGESFRYVDQGEQWFNEGVSEFYTWQAASHLGLVQPVDALSSAALSIGYYHGSDRPGRLSLRQAALDDRVKRENYFLVYNGGWTAGLLIDHDIRTRTGNQHSLDDLMRWLHRNYPAQERRYGMDDLLLGLRQTTGLDYRTFFRFYIDGTRSLPVAKSLDIGAAVWAWEFQTPERSVHAALYSSLGISHALPVSSED